jgi:hypothetical protein
MAKSYHAFYHWQKIIYKKNENAVKSTSTSINNNQHQQSNEIYSPSHLNLFPYPNAANIVHDHKFGELGATVTSLAQYQNDNWKVSHEGSRGTYNVRLYQDDLDGIHPDTDDKKIDKYDLKLKAGETLKQKISGLKEERTYLMRIRVIADRACKGVSLTFGATDGWETVGSRTMNNGKGYFRDEILHSTTFVAPSASVDIFVDSEGGSGDCRPRIREVLLHLV